MPLLTTLLMAACVGVGQGADADADASAPAETAPNVTFGFRDIVMASPAWRGAMLARLEPLARDGGAAVWAIDETAMDEFLKIAGGDERTIMVESPPVVAALGEPAMMSNEDSHHYVAHLERVSDGPPGEGTQLAFKPEVGEIHDGVRVNLLASHFKGPALFARVVVEENRLRGFHTVQYSESLKPAPGADPDVAKASFLGRLRLDRAADRTTLGASIQVPEVDTRRVDYECMLPADGALLISLGPNHRREEKSKPVYAERLIVITARVDAAGGPEGEGAPVQAPEAP